ncbi:zeta toxin family protein [Solimonas fluminis]|uniref:zeta toxin family protein n=1 Tax=Solimonas fluminis TaxID=2086571 RepID=UPI001056EABB|nr:zeta toxin family protein [Solimonas fluminis]
MNADVISDSEPDYSEDGYAKPLGRAADLDALVRENIETFIERYRQKALDMTGNPYYLNADIAKEIFVEYSASSKDRTRNSVIVQAASTRIKEAAFHVLLEQSSGDAGEELVFMAGGTGAGKSTLAPSSGFVYDGNLASIRGARRKIDAALAFGRRVKIIYVYRDPFSAYLDGVLPRALRYGRIVPSDVHVSTHVGAFITFKALRRYYKKTLDVTLIGFAPPGPPPDISVLKAQLDDAIRQELDQGRISMQMASQMLQSGRSAETLPANLG